MSKVLRKNKQAHWQLRFPESEPSAENVKSWLMQAIMATGSPVSWLQPLSVIAQKESGGNPRAYNGWDINAKRGDPSRGLMQTIGQTFNAYKGKGMNDIFNPVHNAVAAINYIKSRYGSPFNTPGIKSMARGGAYKGYANGGLITSEQIARVGEGGKREWIIPEERGIRGRYLLQRAAGALGMEVQDPAEGSGSISSAQAAAATTGGPDPGSLLKMAPKKSTSILPGTIITTVSATRKH